MRVVLLALLAILPVAAPGAQRGDARTGVADEVVKLTRDTVWTPAGTIPIQFVTHHPQGMVKIGDAFFVSSVEIKVPTKRFAAPAAGYDRDTGEGVGHLFKIDLKGNLVADLRLGDGSIYHPGGIDFDGRDIWVPVAEYRPNSRAIVYRVDPSTMRATEVLRFADHLGAIVHDVDDGILHAVSWGSRRFYRWTVGKDGRVASDGVPENRRRLNPSHYVDYQDCKYAGDHRMLCTGVTEIRPPGASPLRLGGLDLVDLRDGRPLHQLPVLLWTPKGLDMTHNPVWIERTASGIRAYFMPEDDASAIYTYDVDTRGADRR